MTITYKSAHIKPGSEADKVRQMIAAQAALPGGFVVRLHGGDGNRVRLFEACQWLVDKGFIFKARRSNNDIKYFRVKADADAYLRDAPAPKPVKPGVQSGFLKTAEIVFTPATKYTRIATPEPRFVAIDIPFQHGHLRAMPGCQAPSQPKSLNPQHKEQTA